MNSQNDQVQSGDCNKQILRQNSDQLAKAKAMAAKYEKYYKTVMKQKQKSNNHQNTAKITLDINSKVQCLCIAYAKTYKMLSKCWNIIMPRCMRGFASSYEQLMQHVPRAIKNQVMNIPFSRKTIEQAVEMSKINLLITYTKKQITQTMQKLYNNQQINSVINKNAQIFPILIKQSEKQRNKQNYIQNIQQQMVLNYKIKQLIENIGSSISFKQQVFIIWKGLFEEIVVIGHFELSQPQLSKKIIQLIQKRQSYQQLIRRLANVDVQNADNDNNKNKDMICEQTSMNKLSACEEQSTNIQNMERNDQYNEQRISSHDEKGNWAKE